MKNIRPFKLLGGFEVRHLPHDLASWMWVGENDGCVQLGHDVMWELYEVYTQGIEEFLRRFPSNFIVPVESITANNITHTGYSNALWGFDIQNDTLKIEYWSR